MTLLYYAPWWLLIAMVVFLFVAVACAGHVCVRRWFRMTDYGQQNEVAGFIIAVIGVIYAVLLAFVTIVVWERFAAAENHVSAEVDAAIDIWRLAARADATDRHRIHSDVTAYTNAVLFDEWPKMKHGKSSGRAQSAISSLFDDVAGMAVPTLRESNVQNRLLDRVQVMADLRRGRVYADNSGVPGVLWLALVVGAVTVIGFEYLFGLKNFKVQLLMTAATATVIGLSFAVVIELDYPFRGDVSISPERWAAFDAEIRARH